MVSPSERVEVLRNPERIQGKHTKLLVRQSGRIFEAIGWDKPDLADEIREKDGIDIVYSLQFSTYRGEERLCLSLEDVRIS